MHVIKESYKFARKYTPAWVFVIFCGIVNVACVTLLPQVPQLMLDRVISPALGAEPVYNEGNPLAFILNGVAATDYMTLFLRTAVACLAIILLRYVTHYVRWNVSHCYGVKVDKDMRMAAFDKLLGQNSLVLDRYTSGDLLSICNSDTIIVKDFYAQNFSILLDFILSVVVAVFFLTRIHWSLVLCPLALAVLTSFVTVRYIRTLRKRYTTIREAAADLNTTVSENINGVRIIRAFSTENVEIAKFDRVNGAYRDAYVTHAKTVATYQAIFNSMGQIINITSLVIGTWLAVSGRMSTGEFATFLTYIGLINPNLINIINYLGVIQNTMICGQRLFTFLGTANVISSPEGAPAPTSHNIELHDVSVCLDDHEQIHNVTLDLPYGKKLGIMGRTGAGKSVLIKTLPRLFESTGGEVLIGGRSIKTYDVEEVRRMFSPVFQEVFLFSDTIASNIAFYDPEIDDAAVHRAAELADAAGFIDKLPDGYETVVGERGLGLSGGQKQRISIARALLKDAPVLLFDDCTSALDLETERRILHNIETEYPDRTLVIASHRASSVEHCDEILYLEDGVVVERGTHAELMQLSGRYYRTYTAQAAQRQEAIGQ